MLNVPAVNGGTVNGSLESTWVISGGELVTVTGQSIGPKFPLALVVAVILAVFMPADKNAAEQLFAVDPPEPVLQVFKDVSVPDHVFVQR